VTTATPIVTAVFLKRMGVELIEERKCFLWAIKKEFARKKYKVTEQFSILNLKF